MIKLNNIIMQDIAKIASGKADWSKLQDKTVLVAGAGGMIASYMIYTLLYLNDTADTNITVLAMVRNEQKAKGHFVGIKDRSDLKFIIQDVCTPALYEGAVDYIVHAASQASPRHFIEDPTGTAFANTIGTIHLLNLAVEKKAKGFLYLSTREIYGKPIDSKEYVSEDDYGALDPTLVRSCYPESKRMSETLCASYRHQYSIDCKIARIAHTYGPGMTIGDGRVVGDFIKNVINGDDITLSSDGSAALGLTYLGDLTEGLFMLMLNFNDFVYNISNHDEVITVRELAMKMADMYPSRNIKVTFQISPISNKSGYLTHKVGLLKSSKAINEGWAPSTGIEEGMRRTIEFFETEKR
jgi:nucleoside-diphosphate-sugar epimerase